MDDVHEAHTRLTVELNEVGLQVQPFKSCVYSEQPAQSQQLATDLGVKLSDLGLVVAGCPVGQSGFVREHVTAADDTVIAQISKLQGLSEMPMQSRLQLLRKSLLLKTAHFMRCVESELLQEHWRVRDMFLFFIDRQQSEVDIDQLYLPCVSKAGYLAAASQKNQLLSSFSRKRLMRSLPVTGNRSRHS